ncbi:RusA family crossover junction endodeoxyribonuclease [Diaphorobacter caeni]|uniref:RusA family crossover junction endodeoxyribonuclease n=1 Tax=Diaphorobacter caeni TaxID=2784387 RepID=UPI00188DC89F|nr:RusA family crossover junction endodeoxyribonuclease [Diaphorobacter caeni]MBF5006869.1 RusA family crossover junction endodeoxyribonuclease [Diaphorobacter caeni]
MIELTLPYPISANRYWKHRVMNVGGRMQATQYVSKEAKEFKEHVGWLARAAGVRAPLLGRVAIAYTLHPHRPQDYLRRMKRDPAGWEDTVQCIDLDNAQKVLLDALKGIVMEDDKWVRSITATRGEPVEGGKLVVRISLAAAPVVAQATLELA